MDVLMPSLEELKQIFRKPDKEEVMWSMEHLYAIPSEKLRVWTVWLTNVGEIADEWHKWLRTYIDLITRIAERLQMAAEKRTIESSELELLKDEEKMIEMLKNLTHQATLYRSYYKHWKNIADQATKETVSRKVTPTTIYRRRFELPMDISQNAQNLIEEAESAQPTEETAPAALMPTLDGIDSMDSPGQNELETMPTMEPSDDDLVFLPEIIPVSPAQDAIAKREAARKLIMDMPSADQSNPYFFYLRTEPDIDIAIAHNDEKVIPPDPNLEHISVNRKYLYFNLSDK